MNATAPAAKVQKTAAENVFVVLINGEQVATLTKSQRNVAAKQGNTRTGYKMKTVWQIQITAVEVPLGRRFSTVMTSRKDAVDIIVETIVAARAV